MNRWRWGSVTVGLITVIGMSAALGQNESETEKAAEPEKTDEDAFQELFETKLLEEFRQTAQAHLKLTIEDLKKSFELEEADVRKLEIAAKGASVKFVDKYRESIRSSANNNRGVDDPELVFIGGKPLAESTKKDKPKPEDGVRVTIGIQESSMRVRVRHQNGSSSRGFSGGLFQLRSTPIWRKTIDSVLEADQVKEYEQVIASREDRLKEAAINWQVARLAIQFHLDEKQSEVVRKLLIEKLRIPNGNMNMVEYYLRRARDQIEPGQLSELLSEAQNQLWRHREVD